MNQEGIVCRRVTKNFAGIAALNGLNLEISGEGVVAIIGPNGAGKSTLLDVLTCRTAPDAGEVRVCGTIMNNRIHTHDLVRLGVARTFQELRLFRVMTVMQNLIVARRTQEEEGLFRALAGMEAVARNNATLREEMYAILKMVGLELQAEHQAGLLSYGQQKLVALAQCLATGTRILLLDEPVAGVHPKLTEEIGRIMTTLGTQGKLVIFVEHDIAMVRKIAQRVVVMDQGRVIADGPPDQVLNRPEILDAYIG